MRTVGLRAVGLLLLLSGYAWGGTVTSGDVTFNGGRMLLNFAGIDNSGSGVSVSATSLSTGFAVCLPTCGPSGVVHFSGFENDFNSGTILFALALDGLVAEGPADPALNGTSAALKFPFIWSLDLFQYDRNVNDPRFGPPVLLFQLTASGTGIGTALGHYMEDGGNDPQTFFYNDSFTFDLAPQDSLAVPEPASLALVGLGGFLLLAVRISAAMRR